MNYLFAIILYLGLNIVPFLAQTTTTSAPTDLGGWLAIVNVGVAGIGLLAFVRGWIVPGRLYDQALLREKEREEQNERLEKLIHESVLPELNKSNDIQIQMIGLANQFIGYVEDQQRSTKKYGERD